ncbi:MAG TPA: hypothetical protein DCL44_03755 [Elusimicrobia bacterium]|nr:hypothetical protein [Elusimicrobiota bacterium]
MRYINKILALTAMFAFSCGISNAVGLEKEAVDSSNFGFVNANTGISLPTPEASSVKSGSSAEMEEFFKYMGDVFKVPKARSLIGDYGKSATAVPGGRVGAVVYSFKLDDILNSYIDCGLSFATSAGTVVKLSGYTASNCPDGGQSCADKERFFLILSAGDKGTYFIKATDVVNAVLMSGSRTVKFDADEFTVKIQAKLSNIPASKIEISRGGAIVFSTTLKKLGEAVSVKGSGIRLGRAYTLAYGNELIQGKGGAKFNNKLVIVLSPVGVDGFYFLNRADITAAGVTYPEMEAGYGFRIVGDTLEIFKIK